MDILDFIILMVLMFIGINFIIEMFVPSIKESKSISQFPNNLKNKIADRNKRRKVLSFIFDYNFHLRSFMPYIIGFVSFMISYFLKDLKNINDIFILTLTVILVYATLSLLTLTYSLILSNRNKDVIKYEVLNDEVLTKILDAKKEEEEKERLTKVYIEDKYNKSFKLEAMMKKSGEIFLMATLLSAISFLLIYGAVLFTTLPLNSYNSTIITFDSVKPYLTNSFFDSFLISIYYTAAAFFLISSIINFIKGLIVSTKILREKFYNSFT